MRKVDVGRLVERLPVVAEKLRGAGVRVGTSQLVQAASLLSTYASLKGSSDLPLDEALMVLEAGLSLPAPAAAALREAVEYALRDVGVRERAEAIAKGIEERMAAAGLRPGQRVSRKSIVRGGGREKLRAYLELKRLGVIRGPPGRERVASHAEIDRVAWRLARLGYSDADEAVRDARLPRLEDDLRLQAEELGLGEGVRGLSTRQLLRLARIASSRGHGRLLGEVAEELARRIRSGASVDAEALRYLRQAGILGPREEAAILSRRPGDIDVDIVGPEEVARLASMLPDDRAARLVAKALRQARSEDYARAILERVDPALLWEVRGNPLRGSERSLLHAAAEAARSLREALTYAETGLEGHADMAVDLAERSVAMAGELPEGASLGPLSAATVKALAEAAVEIVDLVRSGSGESGRLARVLAGLPPHLALRALRGMYRRGGPLRDASIEAAERLLTRLSSTAGSRLLPRYVTASSRPGRLLVRDTVYRIVRRESNPVVYRRRLKARQLTLALDVSGSMAEYSVWALAIALAFARNVRDLILFSGRPVRLKGPLTPREAAEAMLSAEFTGSTDIYAALKAVGESPSKRAVVVTDLKQTVASGDVPEAVAELRRRGFRVVFIVPPSHDALERGRIESVGGIVRVAYKPLDAAREVLYALRR